MRDSKYPFMWTDAEILEELDAHPAFRNLSGLEFAYVAKTEEEAFCRMLRRELDERARAAWDWEESRIWAAYEWPDEHWSDGLSDEELGVPADYDQFAERASHLEDR